MGNTELLKNIVPLEEKNKGKNEYLYSLCFSKPINVIFVRRDIILSQQGHEIQWTFVLKWELILPGVIWESRECFQWNMSIRDIVTKWSYTHTDKFMFAWPLIAFYNPLFIEYEYTTNLGKVSAQVLMGINESNTMNVLFIPFFKQPELRKEI